LAASALILACAAAAVVARGGDRDGDSVRILRVGSAVRGGVVLEPPAQRPATAPVLAEPRGAAPTPSPATEFSGARKSEPSPESGAPAGAAEGLPGGSRVLWATHYGGGSAWGDAINYNGGVLGCGLYGDEDGDNLYSSWDPTIAAVGYGSPWGCGSELLVCGPAGCQAVIVQDACPGCGADVIDLSEAAHERVCGAGTCEVTVEVPP
jgi:hypothetical protein